MYGSVWYLSSVAYACTYSVYACVRIYDRVSPCTRMFHITRDFIIYRKRFLTKVKERGERYSGIWGQGLTLEPSRFETQRSNNLHLSFSFNMSEENPETQFCDNATALYRTDFVSYSFYLFFCLCCVFVLLLRTLFFFLSSSIPNHFGYRKRETNVITLPCFD